MYRLLDTVYVWIESEWIKSSEPDALKSPFDYYKAQCETNDISVLFIGGDRETCSQTSKDSYAHLDIRLHINLTTDLEKQYRGKDEQEHHVFNMFPHTSVAGEMIKAARRRAVDVQTDYDNNTVE